MKLVLITLLGVGLLAAAGTASAQEDRKLRNDHTYSTHNYKHPNKAAAARRWEQNTGVAVQQPNPGDATLANYKRQVPVQQPVGGITVEHTPSTDVADRNYKIQRPSQTTQPYNANVASKRKNRMVETTIGD